MADKKRNILETVYHLDPYEFEGSLEQAKVKIQSYIDKYGPEARIDWEPDFYHPYDNNSSPRYNIIREREETDEEQERRSNKETEDKQARETRDRAEFERLKKLLGEQ